MQSYSNTHQDYSADNEFDYGRRQPERESRTRRSQVKSRSRATSFNGIHRRRNKHWTW